jgi:hypothetical protein
VLGALISSLPFSLLPVWESLLHPPGAAPSSLGGAVTGGRERRRWPASLLIVVVGLCVLSLWWTGGCRWGLPLSRRKALVGC